MKAAGAADRIDLARSPFECRDGRHPDDVERLARAGVVVRGKRDRERPTGRFAIGRVRRPIVGRDDASFDRKRALGGRVCREERAAGRIGHLEVVLSVGKISRKETGRRRRPRGHEDVGPPGENLRRRASRSRRSDRAEDDGRRCQSRRTVGGRAGVPKRELPRLRIRRRALRRGARGLRLCRQRSANGDRQDKRRDANRLHAGFLPSRALNFGEHSSRSGGENANNVP